jgi:hypothetical protein
MGIYHNYPSSIITTWIDRLRPIQNNENGLGEEGRFSSIGQFALNCLVALLLTV